MDSHCIYREATFRCRLYYHVHVLSHMQSYKPLIAITIATPKNIARLRATIKLLKTRKTCIKCKGFCRNKENIYKTT